MLTHTHTKKNINVYNPKLENNPKVFEQVNRQANCGASIQGILLSNKRDQMIESTQLGWIALRVKSDCRIVTCWRDSIYITSPTLSTIEWTTSQ